MEDVEVDEGEPATLEMCFASDTSVTVAWSKDMRPVEQGRRIKIVTDEHSSKLVIKKTVGKDEGLYKCSVQSGDQELNSSAELIVEGTWKFIIFVFECLQARDAIVFTPRYCTDNIDLHWLCSVYL